MLNYSNNFIKKTIISIGFVVVFAVIAFALCGCNGVGLTSADKDKAQNQAYMTELNTISHDFGNIINDFQADVKNKNVDSMKNKLEASNKLIDEFNKLEVPEACQSVHKTYGDAFLLLQQSLSNYVQIYSDSINNNFDSNVLNQRVADAQNSYNQGINLLNQADKMALDI